MDKCNEHGRAVKGPKRHHIIRLFFCIWTGECKFGLGIFLYPNLIISLRGIPHPHPTAVTKGEVDHGVTVRDGVGDLVHDLIKWNVIDSKMPDKVINVAYMLLMWLGSKKCFKHPFIAVDLMHGIELC